MPDTLSNQARYPQQSAQKEGLGFPICRFVGITCFSSGAVLDAAIGGFSGKGADEQTLLRSLLHNFKEGDIVLGDAFYCTYFLLAELQSRGVDLVFEQHGARKRTTDFSAGKSRGSRDHLVTLSKPKIRPGWMSIAAYESAPDRITVRELKAGGKILVTTLCCPNEVPKAAVKDLYKSRWHIESDLRMAHHYQTCCDVPGPDALLPAGASKSISLDKDC